MRYFRGPRPQPSFFGFSFVGDRVSGGDRNIFFRHEGRPIRRSSHILVEGASAPATACYTAHDIFRFALPPFPGSNPGAQPASAVSAV